MTNDAEKCAHLQDVFNELPRQHKDCLEFLMFHLSRVASREKENLVSFCIVPMLCVCVCASF